MSLYNEKELEILDGAESILEEFRQDRLSYNDIARLEKYLLILDVASSAEQGRTHMKFLYDQNYVWIQDIINTLKQSMTNNLI